MNHFLPFNSHCHIKIISQVLASYLQIKLNENNLLSKSYLDIEIYFKLLAWPMSYLIL